MVQAILQHRLFIILEFILVCIAVPTIIIIGGLGKYMFAFLWGTTAYCVLIYMLTLRSKEKLWRFESLNWEHIKPMLQRFALSTALLLIFITIYDPERRFGLISKNTDMWFMVMFLYPMVSALPQEFIFCSFFFKRYESLFSTTQQTIIASTIVFAYAHVLFDNIVAPTLSLVAGYFFATTYAKSRSLSLVTLEHALYGNMIFTIGVGWYFWSGASEF